ncbi:MAG: sugar phosphate isomerase/epimerase family protein [Caldilineaceae bacterium]
MFINLSPGTIGVKANLTESLALAQRHGFSGIDFSMSEVADLLDQQGADAVRALFDQAGIRPGAWGYPVDFRNAEAAWQEGMAALPRLAQAAQTLGLDRCSTWIMPCSDERTFAENFEFHAARLRPGAQILADHGVRLGLEWVGPKTLRDTRKHPFIHTMQGMLELGDAIGAGNVGLLVDAYHVYTSHGSNEDIRGLRAAQVVNVHVNDAPQGLAIDEQLDGVRDLPGATGVLDLTGFLHALRHIGYDGPVTAEPFSQRLRELPADQAVAATAAAMQAMWAKAGF